MSGTFNIARSVWHHPAFKPQAFTECQAWLWMVSEASWKPRAARVGDLVIDLDRGELALSSRFAAKAWGWTDSKARRFVSRLQKLEMISAKTDAGVTVVTICNYDKYQGGGARSDAGPTQDRRRTDAKQKKDERRTKEGCKEELDLSSSDDVPVSHANTASIAVSMFNEAAEQSGWPKVQKLNPNRSKQLRARLSECGGLDGWQEALRKAAASDFISGRTAKPWTGFGFDFLVKPANFTKLMEGNYDNRDHPSHTNSNGPGSGMVQAFAAVAKRRSGG